jgi:hypothetical protein
MVFLGLKFALSTTSMHSDKTETAISKDKDEYCIG